MLIKYIQQLRQIRQIIVSPLFALINWYGRTKREQEWRKERNFIVRLQKEEQEFSVPTSVPQKWREQVEALRSDFHKKFSRFVIWGQQDAYIPYRFIHRACYYTAKRLGIPTIWLKDEPASVKWLFPGDLLMGEMNTHYDPSCEHVKNLRPWPDIFYCLDCACSHDLVCDLDKEQCLLRQEHRNNTLFGSDGPNVIRLPGRKEAYYNPELNFLCQAYGTDLLPWEFMPPVFVADSKRVNYVGFCAGDPATVNNGLYADFDKYLKTIGLNFRLFDKQTTTEHQKLIRLSRLAPMLGGSDREENYPHCRMFKNISYGQLGYSNIPIHQEIYKDCHPPVGSIEEMSDYVLGMSESDYTEMVHEQQKVTQNYTLLQYLANLFKYF